MFLPLGRIAWLEGGHNAEEGMAAAVENALSCLQAGPDFYRIHAFTKKIRWAYNVEGCRDAMLERWTLKSTWKHKMLTEERQKAQKAEAAVSGEQAEEAAKMTPEKEPPPPGETPQQRAARLKREKKAQAGSTPRPKAKAKAKTKGKGAQKARGLAALKGSSEVKSKQMKNNLALLLHRTENFKKKCQGDKEWEYADGDFAQLDKLLQELNNSTKTGTFGCEFMDAADFGKFKKKKLEEISQGELDKHFERFNHDVDEPMLDLIDHVANMEEMHVVRQKRRKVISQDSPDA